MTDETPPHYILAAYGPELQKETLERLINSHLEECPGCLAWKDRHPGSDWRSFVSESLRWP